MTSDPLSKIEKYIARCHWTWARTYVSVPHEYIVKGKCDLTDEEFAEFVKIQREQGILEQWHQYNHPYLYVNGWKYWTMGDPIEETTIINRQKVFRPFDAKQLIRDFVAERLNGNLEALATFELPNLEGDTKFGNPDRSFDADDTELMRAIYCVVFRKSWPNLNENLQMNKLRGDTMNTFGTLFGRVKGVYRAEVHPGLDQHHPSADIVKRVEDFHHICRTIGNMTVLPNAFTNRKSINIYRGWNANWRDYEDRFLSALYHILTDQEPKDSFLVQLIKANGSFFTPYYGKEGWKNFIDLHFLNDYVDEAYTPIISSKGYFYWNTWSMTDEQYLAEVQRFCEFSTRVIQNRAQRMMELIRKEIE